MAYFVSAKRQTLRSFLRIDMSYYIISERWEAVNFAQARVMEGHDKNMCLHVQYGTSSRSWRHPTLKFDFV